MLQGKPNGSRAAGPGRCQPRGNPQTPTPSIHSPLSLQNFQAELWKPRPASKHSLNTIFDVLNKALYMCCMCCLQNTMARLKSNVGTKKESDTLTLIRPVMPTHVARESIGRRSLTCLHRFWQLHLVQFKTMKHGGGLLCLPKYQTAATCRLPEAA